MLHLENFFEKSFALLLTTPNSASGIKIELFFLCIRCKINTMHKISCVCSKCKLQFVCIRSRKAADICFYSDKNEAIFGGINGNTRKNL